jgi:hypothetical protein
MCLVLWGAGCDQKTATGVPGIVPETTDCTPMPVECPEQLACDVATLVGDDGEEVRACGGRSCCQSFCELNGCDTCCVTPFP